MNAVTNGDEDEDEDGKRKSTDESMSVVSSSSSSSPSFSSSSPSSVFKQGVEERKVVALRAGKKAYTYGCLCRAIEIC